MTKEFINALDGHTRYRTKYLKVSILKDGTTRSQMVYTRWYNIPKRPRKKKGVTE